jgi:hypothetical protein
MSADWKILDQTVHPQGIDEVSTTQNHPFGYTIRAEHATYGVGTFKYVKGVASGREGAWVTYDPGISGVTALLAANAIGPVGIMMADLDAATDFGFIMVEGKAVAEATTTSAAIADNGDLYATATGAEVDDTVVTGDRVWGAKAASVNTTLGKVDAEISWPFVDNAVNSGAT